MKTSHRTLFYMLGYIMGSVTVPGMVCRLFWGNWGRTGGAGVAFGFGLATSLVILAVLQVED